VRLVWGPIEIKATGASCAARSSPKAALQQPGQVWITVCPLKVSASMQALLEGKGGCDGHAAGQLDS